LFCDKITTRLKTAQLNSELGYGQ